MFFELIGVIVAGAAVALIVWAITRTLKGRLPKWLIPASAGVAMLIATVSMEYGWFARTSATMPAGLVVAETIEAPSPLRPWTLVWPYVSRFVAVDRASLRTHDGQPDQRIMDLVFYGRWARTAKVPMLFDCAGLRWADIADGVDFAADGAVTGAAWLSVAADDPVLTTACAEA